MEVLAYQPDDPADLEGNSMMQQLAAAFTRYGQLKGLTGFGSIEHEPVPTIVDRSIGPLPDNDGMPVVAAPVVDDSFGPDLHRMRREHPLNPR
jgi:hypothetical protein